MKKTFVLFFSFIFLTLSLYAEVVDISEGLRFVKVESHGKTYKIERTQKKGAFLSNNFALTSRPSPPFFIEPFSVSDEVETYGELEVLSFISHKKGIFIDARLENWYAKSYIPGAINIPFKLFLTPSKKRQKILKNLGASYNEEDEDWDFSDAKTVLFYCNGAWCGQSPTAINALLDLGYPAKKMKYYRGGMQAWQLLGLTIISPKEKK